MILFARWVNARVWFVPDDYPTIQQAIDISIDGDEIVVRDGVYHGEGFKDITYRGKTLIVRSENGSETCVITGQFEEETCSAFLFNSSESVHSHLIGFKFTEFDDQSAVKVTCARPTISSCRFVNNGAPALYISFNPQICDLINPSIEVDRCIFDHNETSGNGSALNIDCCRFLSVSDCVFVNNSGYDYGGAVFIWNCAGHVTNCVFESNTCRSWSVSDSYGGAVCTWSSSVRFENCLFFDNQVVGNYYPPTEACSYGGAISLDSWMVSEPNQLINCTFVDNEQWIFDGSGGHSPYSFGGGGAIYVQWGYAADIINCAVWYNEDLDTLHDSLSDSIFGNADYTVDSCWIEFHPSGPEPPQFEDYENDLFYLSSTSPLIDQGNAPASEICFETSSGTQCLSEMTTQITGEPDTGMADIGYHYRSTPSPEPTETPIPTITPTPTDTPVPTVTPTPTTTPTIAPSATPPDGIRLTLDMPDGPMHAGDSFYLDIMIDNSNEVPLTAVPLFCILEVAGTFWYHPDWILAPAWESLLTVPAGSMTVPILPTFEWPDNAGAGHARFWGALTNPEITRIIGQHDVREFDWE